MTESKQQTQSRFFLAALLSMAVLFGWQYFFAPKKPQVENANTAQVATNTTAPPSPEVQQNPVNPQQTVASMPDNTPNKSVTIKTPLYQVKLDSKGALATSWILIKNKSPKGETLLFADGSTENDKKPLELISPEGLNRSPREIPFRFSTGDPNIDNLINERNYQVSVNEETVDLGEGQSKQIDYVLKDEASGLEVTKSFIFHADSYLTDLQVKLTRNGQIVPNTKLLIGASIGDHGIKFHNYYHIEPESVAFVNGETERYQAPAITDKKEDAGRLVVGGEMDWAGIGDAYFAMAAIPSRKAQGGLEFRATKYEIQTEPYYDGIISWITRAQKTSHTRHLLTGYVPILAAGSITESHT